MGHPTDEPALPLDTFGPPLRVAIDSQGRIKIAYQDGTFVPGIKVQQLTITDTNSISLTLEMIFGDPSNPPTPNDD